MGDINKVCDYVIFRMTIEGESMLSNLKLQKLLYYIQAWHLAFYDKPLFDGKFQAWVHGPVNRDVYDRFKSSKYLYSQIVESDILDRDSLETFNIDEANHINSVLEVYATFSDVELETMTHQEDPWLYARKGYSPSQRCESEINEILMRDFYKQRLS